MRIIIYYHPGDLNAHPKCQPRYIRYFFFCYSKADYFYFTDFTTGLENEKSALAHVPQHSLPPRFVCMPVGSGIQSPLLTTPLAKVFYIFYTREPYFYSFSGGCFFPVLKVNNGSEKSISLKKLIKKLKAVEDTAVIHLSTSFYYNFFSFKFSDFLKILVSF